MEQLGGEGGQSRPPLRMGHRGRRALRRGTGKCGFWREKGQRMEIYIGTPNERQKEFLRCEKKYIAFGGARGGG